MSRSVGRRITLLISIVLTTVSMNPQVPPEPNPSYSASDRAEVASLDAEVTTLGYEITVSKERANFSNRAKIWLALFSGVLALLSWFSQYMQADYAEQGATKEARRGVVRDRMAAIEANALRRIVAEANERAASANERAQHSSKEAADAGILADRTAIALVEARKELQDGASKLAAEQERAAKATQDALNIQTKVNGSFLNRLLSRHVDLRLRETLKALPPGAAEISSIDWDNEAIVFALEIRDALANSGWKVGKLVTTPRTSQVRFGIEITNRSMTGLFPFASEMPVKIMFDFLKAGGKEDPDIRLAVLSALLQVSSLVKDEGLANGTFKIDVGENRLPGGFPLPPK